MATAKVRDILIMLNRDGRFPEGKPEAIVNSGTWRRPERLRFPVIPEIH